MRPDLAGRQYFGLPVVGFAATRYVNGNAGGTGVLGTYSFDSDFRRGQRACARDGVVGACP